MTSTDDQHRVDPATGAPAPTPGTPSTNRVRVRRQLPTVHDLAPLMQFKKPALPGRQQRLESALTIWDLRRIAARRTPKAAFDYTEGAAEAEISLARARQAFEDIEFTPAILRDVSKVDTSREVLGAPTALPFGIAPTGFTRMMQTEGERAGARAAGRAGIPFSLSTMGTTAIEDVRDANPHGRNWFQLYMWKDRDKSMALVDRAAKAGFDTLLVTVDVPVAGARLRDKRNGFSIPPQLGVKTIVNAIPGRGGGSTSSPRNPSRSRHSTAGREPSASCWTTCSTRRSPTRTWRGSGTSGRARSS